MKYTLDQIRDYLTGWILLPETEYNDTLYNVLNNLEDEEDGIKAMVERQREMHVSTTCVRRFASAAYLIEELPAKLCRPDADIGEVLEFIEEKVCEAYEMISPEEILENIICEAKALESFITGHGGHVHEA